MSYIQAIGKFLDQPILTAKISKKVPVVLAGTSGLYLLKEASECDNEKKEILKKGVILAATIFSAIKALVIASKTARCVGMISGIILTGVAGGSMIANFIGKKIINPLISKDKKYENRSPELLDISLHADDIATVSLLSGLKWIEPALPVLYSVSGYRAGIGYRN